ncbi:imidazole glycerol phosphate synthase subunit HisH [Stetteria hydrogenophila]
MRRPLVAVLKYGVGNVYSVRAGLERAGASVAVVETLVDPRASRADGLVLPGVGSYRAASRALDSGERGRILELASRGTPVLGICLGMQLFFEESEEGGGRGLGVLPGRVERLRGGRVPHIGWERVHPMGPSTLLRGVEPGSYFYFAHSYAYKGVGDPWVRAVAEVGGEAFAAVVEAPPFYGVQFHPEKSSAVGLRVLRNFVSTLQG